MIKKIVILLAVCILVSLGIAYSQDTTSIYSKTVDGTLKRVQTTTTSYSNIYSYDELIRQKEMIRQQKDQARYDRELAELDEMIVKCKELGIKVELTK
jgi:pyridoxine 5'-phosphate synthase PdxJ